MRTEENHLVTSKLKKNFEESSWVLVIVELLVYWFTRKHMNLTINLLQSRVLTFVLGNRSEKLERGVIRLDNIEMKLAFIWI